jgi:polyisoprenoid-binding protein YceI
MRGRGRTLLIVALVVVVVAGAGLAWLVLREDAPDRAALRTRAPDTTASGPATADGTWKVRADDPELVFVGYRIKELFGGETIQKTAVGRTGDVAGTLTIEGTTITEATVVAQVDGLQSDRTARDTYLQTRGLETDRFPEATFTLADPVTLDAPPSRGEEVSLTVQGTLELHGQRQTVDVPVKARWNGPTIDITGSTPIALADYDIEVISTPVVEIDDRGELELQLTFVPA